MTMLRPWMTFALLVALSLPAHTAGAADDPATRAEIEKQAALLASDFRAAEKAAPLPPPGRGRVGVEQSPLPLTRGGRVGVEQSPLPLAGGGRVGVGPEDAAAKEYRTLLERYLPYIKSNLKPFPADARSLFHKSDNSQEHAVRQNATVAFALATLDVYGNPKSLKDAPIDPGDTARKLIRYLAITHKANLLPTGDGKPWGDHWQSALWAAFAGHAAWIEWERLDPETRVLVARMVEHEADRFNTRPPDDGQWDDTKAEENAWNAKVIVLAHCMFPQHPRAALWKERSIVYLLNAVSTAADRTSDVIVEGKPVKERISTTVVHDDFTLENHSRVHPDYLAGTVGLQLRNSIVYGLAGLPVSDAALHNARQMMEVANRLTAPNGSNLYVNGQDWWPHRHDVPLMAGGFAAPVLNDRAAAYMEQAALGTLLKMHTRFRDGRAFEPREYTYPNVEEEMMARYAELYLAHRLMDYPKPLSRDEFVRQTSGTWLFNIGGFVLHRTPRKAVSFAWKSPVMGLMYPSADTWFTSPDQSSLLGRLTVEGTADSPAVCNSQNVRLLQEGGFVVTADVSRCEGAVRQQVCLISAGPDAVIYCERLVANRDLKLLERATGSVAFLNEEARPLEDNVRRLTTSAGKTYLKGVSDEPEQVMPLEGRYLNIEDKISMVSAGGGGLAVRAPHAYVRGRLTQEAYCAYTSEPRQYRAGEVMDVMTAGFVCGASRSRRLKIRHTLRNNEVVTVEFEGLLAGVNFSDKATQVTLGRSEVTLPPLTAEVRPD